MTTMVSPASTGLAVLPADPLRSAISAYLGRFKGSSREHTGLDLRVYLACCTEHDVEPLAAQRGSGAVHPLDAGDPPVQTVDEVLIPLMPMLWLLRRRQTLGGPRPNG